MQTRSSVKKRRTIRSFLPDPVSGDVIRELISEARWAPSWGNTQPWEFMIVNGSAMENLKNKNRDALVSGVKPHPEIQMPEKFPEIHSSRYKDVGKSVLTSLSIPRRDLEARMEYYGDMFHLFNAPALLLVLLDRNLLLEYTMLDVGLFLQTFMLLACDRGLGTASLAASVNYPDVLREHLPIPEDKTIAIGVAVGWPDMDAPVNRFERKRAPIDEVTTWVE